MRLISTCHELTPVYFIAASLIATAAIVFYAADRTASEVKFPVSPCRGKSRKPASTPRRNGGTVRCGSRFSKRAGAVAAGCWPFSGDAGLPPRAAAQSRLREVIKVAATGVNPGAAAEAEVDARTFAISRARAAGRRVAFRCSTGEFVAGCVHPCNRREGRRSERGWRVKGARTGKNFMLASGRGGRRFVCSRAERLE